MSRCDECKLLVKCGPNTVPYGDGYANAGDLYECALEYDGDCPEGTFVPRSRFDQFSEADLRAGDFVGDMAREDRGIVG